MSLKLLKGEANRYSVAIRTELAVDLPKIMVDRVQLQQVFMNLMLNAIEAMKDSGGELTVKSELQDGHLQFSVSDTGVGLPTEKMEQIFSAFFTTKPQGSGMGTTFATDKRESTCHRPLRFRESQHCVCVGTRPKRRATGLAGWDVCAVGERATEKWP